MWHIGTETGLSGKRLAASIGAALVLVAIVVGVFVHGNLAGREDGGEPAADGAAVEAGADPSRTVASPAAPAAPAAPGADAAHLDAFRAFVMIDREREPEWMAQVTRVTFTDAG